MDSLIKRLQAAEAGSEQLDAAICIALQYGGANSDGAQNVRTDADWSGDLLFEIGSDDCCNPIPKLTTSLDAIVALIGEKLPNHDWSIGNLPVSDDADHEDHHAFGCLLYEAQVSSPGDSLGHGATAPPRGLHCAAFSPAIYREGGDLSAPFAVSTISDTEAAERLGFPLRTIRAVIDKNALCLRAGRRRRLTPTQFEALQEVLTIKCRSSSIRARAVSSTYVEPSRNMSLTKALALASVQKPKRSERNSKRTCSSARSMATNR